jgi:hypothetical protein
MGEGTAAEGQLAFSDAQFAVIGPSARGYTAVVTVVEELCTKAIKPITALVAAATVLHLTGSTTEVTARFVGAAAAIVAICQGAVNLVAEVILRCHLVQTAPIDLIAGTQTTVAVTRRLAAFTLARRAGFRAVAKDIVVTFCIIQTVACRL